jgi:hypothetical protein
MVPLGGTPSRTHKVDPHLIPTFYVPHLHTNFKSTHMDYVARVQAAISDLDRKVIEISRRLLEDGISRIGRWRSALEEKQAQIETLPCMHGDNSQIAKEKLASGYFGLSGGKPHMETKLQSVSFYCAVAARAHFEISNVHMYHFELQHYENHVTKKYAHINNNRLS